MPCHRRPRRRPRRRCHGLRLEKTLRRRRDCLPRSRSIGREAPSFLRGASYLESDRNFQSSPEVGDASSKSSCRHFSLPWCTPYVNVKLSGACAELGRAASRPCRRASRVAHLNNHIIPMLLVFFLLFLKVVLSDLQFSQGVVFFC